MKYVTKSCCNRKSLSPAHTLLRNHRWGFLFYMWSFVIYYFLTLQDNSYILCRFIACKLQCFYQFLKWILDSSSISYSFITHVTFFNNSFLKITLAATRITSRIDLRYWPVCYSIWTEAADIMGEQLSPDEKFQLITRNLQVKNSRALSGILCLLWDS